MMKKTVLIFSLTVAVLAQNAFAAAKSAKVDDSPAAERKGKKSSMKIALAMTEAKMWKSPNGETLPYRLHVPSNPEQGRRYPLVVHMHGAGSRGTNNLNQVKTGGADFIAWAKKRGEEYIFVAPQCPARQKWVDVMWNQKSSTMHEKPTIYLRMAMEIIDDVCKRYPVDMDRVYVIGISMGGYATWELLQRRPELFAAALPCCGGGDSALASRLVNIPIWTFHGSNDRTVPVVRSRDMVAAIKAAGGTKIEYREYPGVGHNAWTPTFTDDSVFDWLFRQRRSR